MTCHQFQTFLHYKMKWLFFIGPFFKICYWNITRCNYYVAATDSKQRHAGHSGVRSDDGSRKCRVKKTKLLWKPLRRYNATRFSGLNGFLVSSNMWVLCISQYWIIMTQWIYIHENLIYVYIILNLKHLHCCSHIHYTVSMYKYATLWFTHVNLWLSA